VKINNCKMMATHYYYSEPASGSLETLSHLETVFSVSWSRVVTILVVSVMMVTVSFLVSVLPLRCELTEGLEVDGLSPKCLHNREKVEMEHAW